MSKITPYLWFDNNLEEAIEFYRSLFKNSEVRNISRYGDGAPTPGGSIMGATFVLEGQEFMALNGGPQFKFNEAISLFISCKDQEEIDYYWDKLTADGGEESQCGWLKDKFGLSWQVVPESLSDFLGNPDPEKAGRAVQAMLKMKKLSIAELQTAVDGE